MLDRYIKIMVTGGAGFIGSHICEELLLIGKEVTIVDNLSTGRVENIPAGVEFIEMEILLFGTKFLKLHSLLSLVTGKEFNRKYSKLAE